VHPAQALRLVIENLLKLTLSAKRVSKLLFDVGSKNLAPAHQKSIIKLRDDFDRFAIAIIRRGKKAVYIFAVLINGHSFIFSAPFRPGAAGARQ
jgi:hypothetical protein